MLRFIWPIAQLLFSRLDGPPIAPKRPQNYTVGDAEFIDDYLWLRNASDPLVTDYVAAENAYTDRWFAQAIQDNVKNTILEEIHHARTSKIARECYGLGADFDSFWTDDKFIYWTIPTGAEYPVYMRRELSFLDACSCVDVSQLSQIVVDLNTLGVTGTLGFFEPNPFDADLIVFGVDAKGDERFSVYLYQISSGRSTLIASDSYYSCRWFKSENGQSWVYYNVVNSDSGTPRTIMRFGPIGSLSLHNELVYVEKDYALTAELVQTNDVELLFVKIAGQVTTEYLWVAQSGVISILERIAGVQYDVEHHSGTLFIRSNQQWTNFGVWTLELSSRLESNSWPDHVQPIVPSAPDDLIEAIEMFREYLLVWFRTQGSRKFKLLSLDNYKEIYLPSVFRRDTYTVNPGMADFESRVFRGFESTCFFFSNTSFLQPLNVYALDFRSFTVSLIVETTTMFDSSQYVEGTFFTANNVPLSCVHKRSLLMTGGMPLFMNSYGAYGGFQDPLFTTEIVPFLSRGVMFAICHPRGDADLGMSWYNMGKYELKQNTFIDTRACFDELVSRGYADPQKLGLKGRSAGGLVAGNSISWLQHDSDIPYLRVVIAHVPFTDPVYDMSDASVPWTPYEWTEWGDPRNKTILNAMLAYSPYNLAKAPQRRPEVYISAGLVDSRVPYWGPLKYAAQLRSMSSSRMTLLVRVNDGGHFIASDEEAAEWICFALVSMGVLATNEQ